MKLSGWKLTAAVVLIAIVGYLCGPVLPRLPWSLDTAFVSMAFYHAFRVIKEKGSKLFSMNVWSSLGFIILGSVLAMVNGAIDIKHAEYALLPLSIANALILSLGYMNLFRFVGKRIHLRWLSFTGQNSIVFLCLNQIVIFASRSFVTRFIDINTTIKLFANRVATLLITLLILTLLTVLFTKSALSVFLGKKQITKMR